MLEEIKWLVQRKLSKKRLGPVLTGPGLGFRGENGNEEDSIGFMRPGSAAESPSLCQE